MKSQREWFLWIWVLVAMVALVLHEGWQTVALEANVDIDAKELYRTLARSTVRFQIIDARTDVVEEYEDAHLPGSIPLPECDAAKAPAAAAERVLDSVPTIIVSADGDAALFERCRASFTVARNLAGGMEAWSDANLPEDSGEYVAPRSAAGGGCL